MLLTQKRVSAKTTTNVVETDEKTKHVLGRVQSIQKRLRCAISGVPEEALECKYKHINAGVVLSSLKIMSPMISTIITEKNLTFKNNVLNLQILWLQ